MMVAISTPTHIPRQVPAWKNVYPSSVYPDKCLPAHTYPDELELSLAKNKKNDENSGHYVIANSRPPDRRPPKRRPPERRTLVPKLIKKQNKHDEKIWQVFSH